MIVDYDHTATDGKPRRFVYDATCKTLGITYHQLDALFRDGARCAMKVGSNDTDVFMGFAITHGGALVFQYTKPALRGDGRYIYNALLDYLLGARAVAR